MLFQRGFKRTQTTEVAGNHANVFLIKTLALKSRDP